MNDAASPRPAHVVVVALGTLGDVFPFLSLGRALVQRGHRVTVVSPTPHDAHVSEAGLNFHGLGTAEEYQRVLDHPDLWRPSKGFRVMLASAKEHLRPIVEFLTGLPRHEPCIVLAHPTAVYASELARSRRADLRIVGIHLAPSSLLSCHDPMMIGAAKVPTWVPHWLRRLMVQGVQRALINPVMLPDINKSRRAFGLAPVAHCIEYFYGIPDLHLTLFPAWFAPHQPDWPKALHSGDFQLHDPAAGQALRPGLADFLSQGPPPIAFTPGSANHQAAVFFKHALQAALILRQRAIFITPRRDQVPAELPPSCLWIDYVSFGSLLPHMAAFVHHGGIGTTAEALRAGVPQLVVPLSFDQFANAERAMALGVADALRASRVQVGPLAQKLSSLLASTTVKARCTAVAARFGQGPDTARVCEALEALVA